MKRSAVIALIGATFAAHPLLHAQPSHEARIERDVQSLLKEHMTTPTLECLTSMTLALQAEGRAQSGIGVPSVSATQHLVDQIDYYTLVGSWRPLQTLMAECEEEIGESGSEVHMLALYHATMNLTTGKLLSFYDDPELAGGITVPEDARRYVDWSLARSTAPMSDEEREFLFLNTPSPFYAMLRPVRVENWRLLIQVAGSDSVLRFICTKALAHEMAVSGERLKALKLYLDAIELSLGDLELPASLNEQDSLYRIFAAELQVKDITRDILIDPAQRHAHSLSGYALANKVEWDEFQADVRRRFEGTDIPTRVFSKPESGGPRGPIIVR